MPDHLEILEQQEHLVQQDTQVDKGVRVFWELQVHLVMLAREETQILTICFV